MKFNTKKSKVTRITHKEDKTEHSYYLSNTLLKSVNSYKDLGVDMSSNLTWSYHVDLTVNKANRVLGLLKRTVGCNNIVIFSMLYKSLLRPILEYACPVWAPCSVKDISSIVKIKRRASRIALGQNPCEMPYEDRCKMLEEQREYLSLIECYKIVFGLNGLDFNDCFEPCRSKIFTANHQCKIQTKSAYVNCFKYSFFVRIIKP